MTEHDAEMVEKAYRENPRDPKARADYLEAGIRSVRARLDSIDVRSFQSMAFIEYGEGVLDGVAFAIELLDDILPASDEEIGLPILTRDDNEDEK